MYLVLQVHRIIRYNFCTKSYNTVTTVLWQHITSLSLYKYFTIQLDSKSAFMISCCWMLMLYDSHCHDHSAGTSVRCNCHSDTEPRDRSRGEGREWPVERQWPVDTYTGARCREQSSGHQTVSRTQYATITIRGISTSCGVGVGASDHVFPLLSYKMPSIFNTTPTLNKFI